MMRNFFTKVIIAVDPAASHHTNSDETGIIVAAKGRDGKAYILDDLSGKYSTAQWGAKVTEAYEKYGASYVVIETNQGGDMAKHVLQSLNPRIRLKPIHARTSKYTRAQPVACLYEQGRVFHTQVFTVLEAQMFQLRTQNQKSPDRVDALVYALTELMLQEQVKLKPVVWAV